MERIDPVHREGNNWYFWDEIRFNRFGPYDTEEECQIEMIKYVAHLDFGDEEKERRRKNEV